MSEEQKTDNPNMAPEGASSAAKGGMRFALARAISAVAAWGLVNIAHREAGNMPGKLARYIDSQVIAHAASQKLRCGSIAIVGTNGKTTVTNLIADALQSAGLKVVCNRSGANLYSGIATALLRAKGVYDWGVFESDELWLARSLPQLRSRYVVLLNLFRDQLDRCGEIDRIQDSIVGALASSPETVLIYNADDPLCAMVAERASEIPERAGVPSIAFGVAEDMGLAQNEVSDCTMCQNCSHMLRYEYRQYGQLGPYACPNCGFSRPALQFAARDIGFGVDSLSFDVDIADRDDLSDIGSFVSCRESGQAHIRANLSGSYMVYNLLAVFAAACLLGCPESDIQRAIDSFDPKNGRLQEYSIAGHRVLLNLAKNPTGFNQNLRIITQRLDAEDAPEGDLAEFRPKPSGGSESAVAAFFINDKEADGHDISWIWDIDFEELAGRADLHVLAGGIRRCDLQVRLKYAGVQAALIDCAADALLVADGLGPHVPVYVITNYTALAPVHQELGELAENPGSIHGAAGSEALEAPVAEVYGGAKAPDEPETHDAPDGHGSAESSEAPDGHEAPEAGAQGLTAASSEPVVIAHLFPDLLNLYGDGGNVRILKQRLAWRGIPVEVRSVTYGDSVDLEDVDLVFMGGGPDGEQSLAAEELRKMRDQLAKFVDQGAPVLAICGGYQIMGDTWLLGDEEVPGLGIIDAATKRPGTSGDRLIDNIALASELATKPVIGYENHASRTYPADSERVFGKVISHTGHGNNDSSAADGVIHNNVIGTYLHGPLLSKNPEVADWLLARALERRARRIGAAFADGEISGRSEGSSSKSSESSGSFVASEASGSSRAVESSGSCRSVRVSLSPGSSLLSPLDDAEEMAANDFMAEKLI